MSLKARLEKLEERIAPTRELRVRINLEGHDPLLIVMGGLSPGGWRLAPDGTREPWADYVRRRKLPGAWQQWGLGLSSSVSAATENIAPPDAATPPPRRESWQDGR